MTLPDPAEARAFLAAHPDIEAIQLVITDASGVGRGKSIAREELEPLFANGRNVAGSILGLDITGEDVEATGLVWSVGDADKLCRPVAGTLCRVPWLPRPTAQVLLTQHDLDGRPSTADPRHVLANVIARLEALGLTPVVAAELEFYLLQRDGTRLVPATAVLDNEAAMRIDSYGLAKLDGMAPLFDAFYAGARAMGLPVQTLMAEYAPGQFEITLAHRADALRAADEAILFKRLMRGSARQHGRIATFMPKPFAEQAGSGLHVHVSLQDGAGRNAFASEDPAGTPLLRHAIGGLKHTMLESTAIFAPNANSYRRFRRMSYAPIAPSWGVNNRSVSLRVPAGPPLSRHVEHRPCGADANPYLAIATVLAGVHHGIVNDLDPGAPVTGNGYAQASGETLPTHWPLALQRAQASRFLRDYLGEAFMALYLAIKTQECDKFQARVSEIDYEWYLDQA
jgi:glutamine synthetase